MQLLMLRGLAQFSRPTARLLFAHASSNVKASCIQRSIAVPQPFLSFDTKVRALLDQHDPAVKLTDLLHKVGAIKEMSQNSNPTAELVLEAIKVDQELIAFSNTPPPTLEYTRDPLAHGPPWTYHRIVHTYPSLRIAKVWNAVRLLRFFLLSFIGGDISPFPDGTSDPGMQALSGLKVYALDHMAGVAADVLATIPCFVHVHNHAKLFSAPARCLAWPLGIIEKSSICPVDARVYARKTLEWLARDLNMPQAIHPDRQPGSREDWYAETHYIPLLRQQALNWGENTLSGCITTQKIALCEAPLIFFKSKSSTERLVSKPSFTAGTWVNPDVSTSFAIAAVVLPSAWAINTNGNLYSSFVSLSIELIGFPSWAGTKASPNEFSNNLIDGLAAAQGSPMVVRVGGNSADRAIYDSSLVTATASSCPNADKGAWQCIGPHFFDSYGAFPKGTLYSHNFNVATWNSSGFNTLAATVPKVCNALRGQLEAFEVGNEPDLWIGSRRPSNYNVQDYLKDWTNSTGRLEAFLQNACPDLIHGLKPALLCRQRS
ncbi:hypothetical protein NQ176_g6340 [Zarea fungicola]|uniref:Uncharacterized protein n=1 Tax=Zarea fungicola TaxID=93591 RepID=A0ACC1N495_9HYPO|nr:hypothetical protein NQ176_g6340 [Lecanicillium fungicola]